MPPAPDGPCSAESATILKDGQMAMTKAPDFLPDLPPSRGAALRKPTHYVESWRCAGKQRRSPLYRPPCLPVMAGELPGGLVVSTRRYRDDTRDWRKLKPEMVVRCFQELEAALQPSPHPRMYPTPFRRDSDAAAHFEGLMTALAVGTLQACCERSYWAPCYREPGSEEPARPETLDLTDPMWARDGHLGRMAEPCRECHDVRVPMSRVFPFAPKADASDDAEVQAELTVRADESPLAACERIASEVGRPHVGLVRFVACGDQGCVCAAPALGDVRGAGLMIRTSYLHAMQEMPRHIHADPVQVLESGSVIYTTDVAILRGPVEEGAIWLANAPRIDVITVALQRNPRCDDQGQHARTLEKALVVETVDRVFGCAAAHGVTALVFPPLGVAGAAACHHPAADAGDLLRKAYFAHRSQIPRVCVCQEYPAQLLGTAWDIFAAALQNGRDPPYHRELVPMTESRFVRPGWEEKRKRLAQSLPRGGGALGRAVPPRPVVMA